MNEGAMLYTQTGAMVAVRPANGRDFTLEEAQKLVGGPVQILPIGHTHWMMIHEEGKYQPKYRRNDLATVIARQAGIAPDDWIHGPAVVCPISMVP